MNGVDDKWSKFASLARTILDSIKQILGAQ